MDFFSVQLGTQQLQFKGVVYSGSISGFYIYKCY